MKFEALILRALCAGSMLVCVLVLGDMLLAQPAKVSATNIVAASTRCVTAANDLASKGVVATPKRSSTTAHATAGAA